VDLLTVGLAIFPTTIQDAHTFERQGAHGDVVFLAPGLLLLVVVFGLLAVGNRASRPFMKGLAQELGAGPADYLDKDVMRFIRTLQTIYKYQRDRSREGLRLSISTGLGKRKGVLT